MGVSKSKLPSQRREAFFEETFWLGATELLCVPTPFGCIVRHFSPAAKDGGQAIYRISKCLSYSSYVPRYEVEAMGVPRPAVVGVLDREEVHMRAKTGEFIRVASWKVTARTLAWKNKHSHREGVHATSSEPIRVVIATQGNMKVDCGVPKPETMQFFESVIETRESSSCTLGRMHPKSLEDLDLMECTRLEEKAGNAKKIRFPGTEGRPYLGLQLTCHDVAMPKGMEHLLDYERLLTLLTLLCWSESTMHSMPDMSESYIEAMMTPVDKQPEGVGDVHWTAEDVKRLLHAEAPPPNLRTWHEAELPAPEDTAESRLEAQDAQLKLVRSMTRTSNELEEHVTIQTPDEVVSPSNAGQKPGDEASPLEHVTIQTPDEVVSSSNAGQKPGDEASPLEHVTIQTPDEVSVSPPLTAPAGPPSVSEAPAALTPASPADVASVPVSVSPPLPAPAGLPPVSEAPAALTPAPPADVASVPEVRMPASEVPVVEAKLVEDKVVEDELLEDELAQDVKAKTPPPQLAGAARGQQSWFSMS